MAVSLKTPPVLADEDGYTNWKQDLEVWRMYTDIDKKRQGPAVYLCLSGPARDCVRDIDSAVLGSETGVEKIIEKLDTLFEKDKNTQIFLAFNNFYDYRRASGVNIVEFLVHFEFLFSKLTKFDIVLPEGVKAFFLLKAANLSEEHERLARATCGQMTYDKMKECIKKIFGDSASGGGDNSAPSVKSEPVFQSGHEDVNYTSGYRNWRGNGRGKGRGVNVNSGSRQETQNYRTNPVDKDGKRLKCFSCGSVNHFSRFCPGRRSGGNYGKPQDINICSGSEVKCDVKPQDIHIALFNGNSGGHMKGLVRECLGKALLDSACTKTVCGNTWLNMYLDTLQEQDKALVRVVHSDTKFRFGDGVEVTSSRLVEFPALIGHKRVMISTDVVSNRLLAIFYFIQYNIYCIGRKILRYIIVPIHYSDISVVNYNIFGFFLLL